ncbi:MAG: HAD family hydrolase [Planctomycetes bacterium]|nr:HAD family hydrolase [Planctomycetota bacterium]
MTRAAFLDRDGTLNREVDFVRSPAELDVLPGAAEALHRLDAAGFRLVVVTNQSGIARGFLGEAGLARIHAVLQQRLGGLPLAWLHCPHHPDVGAGNGYGGACTCRKPAPGLLHQAHDLLGVDFAGSVLIGDSARDLLPARGLPLTTIHVRSGKPVAAERERLRSAGFTPDHEAADLAAAVDWLLAGR